MVLIWYRIDDNNESYIMLMTIFLPWSCLTFYTCMSTTASEEILPPDQYPPNLSALSLPPTNGDSPSIQVSMSRPDSTWPITSYNVYYTNDPSQSFGDWGKLSLPNTGEPIITGIIGNLYTDQTYYISATIVNQAGEGPASFLVSALTSSDGGK